MATAIRGQRAPVSASAEEQAALSRMERLIDHVLAEHTVKPRLVGPDGETIELPESVFHLLSQVVHDLAEGRMVTIVPRDQELTTQEAADLLNVSRPHLVKLLERGEIPYSKTGTHRRIRFVDAMAYKARRDEQRKEGLARLTRMSQGLGLYDE
jgi:excisionase family DNA binding protein